MLLGIFIKVKSVKLLLKHGRQKVDYQIPEYDRLSERKVSRFTGFHSNVGKTFAVFASSVSKVLPAIAQSIHRENFSVLSKICNTFHRLQYMLIQVRP